MSSAEISWSVLGVVAAAIPIVASLWKAFTVIANLKSEISEIRHQNSTEDLKLGHMEDSLKLTANGLLERINHLANRTQTNHERLQKRIEDVEGFLTKSTAFNRRS